MNAIALRMFDADLLKLRRSANADLGLVLGCPRDLLFTVKAIQHSSNPARYGRRRHRRFSDGRLLCLFFGPLARVLVGVEAGTGDSSAGVFRDLVVTDARAWRCSPRASRALAVCWDGD